MEKMTKVLVVDDDRRMVKTLCDILKVKGFDAVASYTGEEAIEMATSYTPDCILMDIRMPGINGVDALEAIKKQLPGVPVVLMSAYATEEMMSEARQKGAYSVLSKPVDIQQILSFLSLLRKEENILIVDDDPNFCKTIGDILQSRSYAVETTDDTEKVLGIMEQNYRLVVVLDMKLGSKSGLDVLKSIRARYPTKPVILVTGYKEDMMGSIEKGLQIGAYTCLYKPFEAETLIKLVEEISIKKLQGLLEDAA